MRPQWRKQGVSDRLHEALLTERGEDLAVLLVDVTHPKVHALYETWGYEKAGDQQPFADSPVYAVMVKRLHARKCTAWREGRGHVVKGRCQKRLARLRP